MVAAQKNNPEVLKILASHGCDLERKSECNKTALDVAVAHKNNESVSFLLEAMDPNTHYPKNSVALQIAMSSRYSEVECLMTAASLMYPYVGFKFETPGQYAWVEWVLNEGGPLVKPAAMRKLMNTAIDNDNVSFSGYCRLSNTKSHQCELLQALIANGCEVNTCLYDGFTPLAHAVRGRSPSMTKLLLDAGADPNVRPHPLISSSKGITPFYEAITSMQNAQGTEIVGILLQSGRCRLNQSMGGTILQGPSYSTAFRGGLLRATTWGDEILTRFVMRIVAAVQDIDGDRTDEGHTFLHAATVYGMVEFINLLLDKGAKLEAIDKEGRTPFLMACCLSPMAVPLLLSKGANICAKTIRNHSALALAAKYGHVEVIRLLIEHGLDIESKGDDGYTPLASALRHGHEQVALELLALGASVDWKTENQETALHLAASSRIPGVVAELLRRGLDLEAKNDMGCTPLYLVSQIPSLQEF